VTVYFAGRRRTRKHQSALRPVRCLRALASAAADVEIGRREKARQQNVKQNTRAFFAL
jgi:hypothetical protein